MTDGDCIFCRIVRGERATTVVHRADGFVAIEDIAPKADMHLLVLPERHLDTFRDVGEFGADEAKRMLEFVAETARDGRARRVPARWSYVGAGAGQTSSTCTGTSSAGRAPRDLPA